MNPIKCLVVDDEKLARTLLEQYIYKTPQLELIQKCRNAKDALLVLEENAIDLMFLDIQMPELTGVEFLKSLTKQPLVIFTTAYSDYALEGYELDVIDYMVKPISFDRFAKGVQKAIAQVELKRKVEKMPALELAKGDDFIKIKADHRIYKVLLEEIQYIEGMREYVAFHLPNKKRIVALESLKRLTEILPKKAFMRVHKSYIINITKVTSVYGNQLELREIELKIPIGKNYKEAVLDRVF